MVSEQAEIEQPLRDRLAAALVHAEAQDSASVKAATLRLIMCAARDRDAIARSQGVCDGCPEARLHELLQIMADQREVSAREYDEAGRLAEAEREREELGVIRSFIPTAMDGLALKAAIEAVVDDLGATKLKDVGRCMDALKARYPGQIDCRAASKAVRDVLS